MGENQMKLVRAGSDKTKLKKLSNKEPIKIQRGRVLWLLQLLDAG